MPMLSYAQNREDVLLARALPGPAGFYIDVGAAHPVAHSVTKWFYDLGWSGVNLEPLPHFFDLIVRDRPRDVNLNAAASDAPGTLTLFEVPHSIGMSTVDPALAGEMTRGGAALIPHAVPARTLRDVCAEHVGDRAIDFLKVDAEGHEHAVLAGADFTRWRPRVLVIETTEPGKPTPNYAGWEPLVLAADYLFATFDGLNRYYVRAEESELAEVLKVPVNVFDDYILAELVREQESVQLLRRTLDNERVESGQALGELRQATEETHRQLSDAQLVSENTGRQLEDTRRVLDETNGRLTEIRHELAETRRELTETQRELAAREVDIQDLQLTYAKSQTALRLASQLLSNTRGHLENAQAAALRLPS